MDEPFTSEPADEARRHEHRTALTDPRRRFVLADLTRRMHPVPVYDLADRLVSWERDRPGADGESPQFDDVRRALRDDHLPKLVAAGLVEVVEDGRYHLTERGLAVEATTRDGDYEGSSRTAEGPPGE